MAISGLNSYNNAMYQWQAQQLKSTGTASGNATSSSAAANLLGSSTSMINQVSSMVELTKYAMDKMGLSGDARVTFSQISRYREQLQNEFNTALKASLGQSGIADLNALGFEMDQDGNITVTGGTTEDRKTAQGWLAANPVFSETLLKAMPADALNHSHTVAFTISSTGRMSVINKTEHEIQTSLSAQENLAAAVRKGLEEAGMQMSYPIDLSFDDDGNLVVKPDAEHADAINAWLKEHDEMTEAVKKELDKKNTDPTAVSMRLGQTGPLQITVNNADLNEIQAALDTQTATGASIRAGLANLGIDENISFSIQVNDDGTVSILSDHPDTAKVQQLFNMNPDLVKKYRQIETLKSLDDARAAMQVSPSAMRKRIQIESMASWWASSGDATSYFGRYADNSLSLLSGLNLSI